MDLLALPEYTGIKAVPQAILKLFLSKLNPTLGAFMPESQAMYRKSLLSTLPNTSEWERVKIYDVIFHMVCKSSARVLLGEKAAQNERWLQVEAAYINTALNYIQGVKEWPRLLRPFAYRRVVGYNTLMTQWNEGKAIIEEHLAEKKANGWKALNDPPSFFDHVAAGYTDVKADDHLAIQIALFIAGVHTSVSVTTHAVFDAAVNVECIDEIRQEVKALHEQCGGEYTRQDLAKLVKLDSFIKEVNRFSPPDLATFLRKSSQEIVLSNGFCIPKGSKLEVPTGAIGMDDSIYENAEVFDGLRFWRMRQAKDKMIKHQFLSVSSHDLDWGYGRHACPGRYMADITIKLLMAEILLNFEIKNPKDQPRYANIEFDGQTMPNTDGEVLMRRIKGKLTVQ
ncbi:hypothetical protein ACHAQA_008585 [Verticillium albo-atrum]